MSPWVARGANASGTDSRPRSAGVGSIGGSGCVRHGRAVGRGSRNALEDRNWTSPDRGGSLLTRKFPWHASPRLPRGGLGAVATGAVARRRRHRPVILRAARVNDGEV